MTLSTLVPPHVAWLTGALKNGPVIRKTTDIAALAGVFSDTESWQRCEPRQAVYDVDVLQTETCEGALFTGVTHLHPGRVGDEFFMTRGHFHARREQGEVYFGLRGSGLLLLQDERGEARLEFVTAGSVHLIPGHTAHRLINTGDDTLSALAVWPTIAGHDYEALSGGFAVRIKTDDAGWRVENCHD